MFAILSIVIGGVHHPKIHLLIRAYLNHQTTPFEIVSRLYQTCAINADKL